MVPLWLLNWRVAGLDAPRFRSLFWGELAGDGDDDDDDHGRHTGTAAAADDDDDELGLELRF